MLKKSGGVGEGKMNEKGEKGAEKYVNRTQQTWLKNGSVSALEQKVTPSRIVQ